MIDRDHPVLSIVRQCELVSVNRSGLYHEPAGETALNLALMRLIDAFRVLEVIYVLTFGGPGDSTEILSLHIYKTAFVGQQLGVAAAISVLLLAVVAALSWGALRLSNPMQGEPR